MKEKLINKMIETERLKLTILQTVDHYSIVIFLVFLWGLTVYSLFEIHVTKTYSGVRASNELILAGLPVLVGAIVFYFIQRARLNFYELTIKFSDEEFEEALSRTTKELKWNIEIHQKKYIRAIRPSNWTGSWGEIITIIKDGDRLLLNSICDPDKIASIASFGWNKKNLRTFSSNLRDTVNQIPAKEIVISEISENEWTLKKTAIRIVTYLFCLFLIVLSIYGILNPINYLTTGAGIGAIFIASMYLYTDLKIITTRK